MNKEKFKTAEQFLFLAAALVVSFLLAEGFSLNFGRITTWSFWVNVAANLAIMELTYNAYYEMDNRNRRLDVKGKYYAVSVEFQNNVKRFYLGDYFDKLDKAIFWKNDCYRTETFDKFIREHCGARFSYADFKDMKSLAEIDDICKKKLVSERAIKKISKAIHKIFDGKVFVPSITVDDVLIDKIGDKYVKDGLLFNQAKFSIAQNAKKMSSYLFVSIIFAVIEWAFSGTAIFETILSKLTLFGSAIYSAIFASRKYIKFRISNLEERNRLLENKVFENISENKILQ